LTIFEWYKKPNHLFCQASESIQETASEKLSFDESLKNPPLQCQNLH